MKAYILPFIFGFITFLLLDALLSNSLIVYFWASFIVFLTFGAVYLYRAQESKKNVFFQCSFILLVILIVGAAFPHVLTSISKIFAFMINLRLSLAMAATILLAILCTSVILSFVRMGEREKSLYDDLVRRYSQKDIQID